MSSHKKFLIRYLADNTIEVECDSKDDAFSMLEKLKSLEFDVKERLKKEEKEKEREEEQNEQEFSIYFNKIPSQREIIKYILKKENFEHSIPEIHNYFFGRVFNSNPDSPEEDSIYRIIYQRIHRVQIKIAREYNGTWTEQWETPFGDKKYKVYLFRPNTPSSYTKIESNLKRD